MCLIDTHALIWFMFDDSNLSEEALKLIKSEKDVYVSIASLWEIAIKQSLGKLDIDVSIEQLASKCKEVDITILPIRAEHLDYIKILPDIHRDPFDRLIVSSRSCNVNITQWVFTLSSYYDTIQANISHSFVHFVFRKISANFIQLRHLGNNLSVSDKGGNKA